MTVHRRAVGHGQLHEFGLVVEFDEIADVGVSNGVIEIIRDQSLRVLDERDADFLEDRQVLRIVNHADEVRDVVFLGEQHHHNVDRIDVRRRDDCIRAVDTSVFDRPIFRRVGVEYETVVLRGDIVRSLLVGLDDDDVVSVADREVD